MKYLYNVYGIREILLLGGPLNTALTRRFIEMSLRNRFFVCVSVLILTAVFAGCGGGGTPVTPGETAMAGNSASGNNSAMLWGMYEITIDPVSMTAEAVPLRGAEFTANVTQFMQPPMSPTHMISLKVDASSDPQSGLFVVDVTLNHPFPGLNFYNGFDVRGILFSDGSYQLEYDTSARYAGAGDTVLLNADGYTRWWNWQEFAPYENIFGPTRGKLAPPLMPTATINGYKQFADGLELEDPLADIDLVNRGIFTSYGSNERRYEIQFKMNDEEVVFDFNYAVCASWEDPDISYEPDFPAEAFSLSANCAEPFLIDVTDAGSTAWYVDDGDNGGYLVLDIEVYDWQGAYGGSVVSSELAGLWLDGDLFATPVDVLADAVVMEGTEASSVYEVEVYGLNLTKSGQNDVWVIAENVDPNTYEPNMDDFDTSPWTWPDAALAAYHLDTVEIADAQPHFDPVVYSIDPTEGDVGETVNATINGDYFEDGCTVELRESDGSMVIGGTSVSWTDATEVLCDFDLSGANIGLYDVVVINPGPYEGSLVEGFEVLMANVIYVDDSNTSGVEDGSQANPYNTIQEGLTAASTGYQVWVDDSDVPYNGPVTLVSGVVLKSVNWDSSDGDDEATIYDNSTGAAVNGADDATIDGFEIDARRYGVRCSGTSPDILNCSIVDLDYSDARGIYLQNNAFPHINNCEVYDVNNATDPGYATFYGIYIENCDGSGTNYVHIERTYVHYVRSTGLLGGSYCWPHGIYINNSDAVVLNNVIVNDVQGGNYHNAYGIRVNASANVEITNCVVYDIKKSYYYGIAYGMHFANCNGLDVRNVIVTHIRKGVGGGGYFQSAYGIYQSGCVYDFEYCDVYDCATSNYQNLTPGTGCISLNPLYTNAGTDFTLSTGSPCIDTGDPTIFDWDDDTTSDMGAYGGPQGDW